jgi:hypothetical protein
MGASGTDDSSESTGQKRNWEWWLALVASLVTIIAAVEPGWIAIYLTFLTIAIGAMALKARAYGMTLGIRGRALILLAAIPILASIVSLPAGFALGRNGIGLDSFSPESEVEGFPPASPPSTPASSSKQSTSFPQTPSSRSTSASSSVDSELGTLFEGRALVETSELILTIRKLAIRHASIILPIVASSTFNLRIPRTVHSL